MTTEHPGTPGAHWETELRRYETVVDDDRDGSPFGWDDPPPNRATRRRAARDARRNQ